MQRRQLFASAVALVLGLSANLAAAQPRDRQDERGPGRNPGQPDGRGPGNPRHDERGPDRRPNPSQGRGPEGRDRPGNQHAGPGRDRGPGAGPDRRFHRGDRLPPDQRRRQYVVNDWRRHRLNAPPRGYHWVQSGADYLLVAVATGLIAQIVLSR